MVLVGRGCHGAANGVADKLQSLHKLPIQLRFAERTVELDRDCGDGKAVRHFGRELRAAQRLGLNGLRKSHLYKLIIPLGDAVDSHFYYIDFYIYIW